MKKFLLGLLLFLSTLFFSCSTIDNDSSSQDLEKFDMDRAITTSTSSKSVSISQKYTKILSSSDYSNVTNLTIQISGINTKESDWWFCSATSTKYVSSFNWKSGSGSSTIYELKIADLSAYPDGIYIYGINSTANIKIIKSNFAIGADISWVTEMEANGIKFYNNSGKQTDLFQLMKDIGMDSVRLRVWVNPENDYGNFSNKADVIAKAKRAKALGLNIMIDFHYSDIFTDPGRQLKPTAWKNKSFSELKSAISTHTKDVLSALKNAGITPKWVQVGNEINAGMLWDKNASTSGGTWDSDGSYTNGYSFKQNFSNLSAFITTGYDATKSIFPNAKVIVHVADGFNYETFKWLFDELKSRSTKYDVIGISHYPQNNSEKSWQDMNDSAIYTLKTVASRYNKQVMVCEVGTKSSNESLAYTVMTDFMTKLKSVDACLGIFYWEPQVYGNWKPSYYNKVGWGAYDMGAFTSQGKPAKVLSAMKL